MLYPLPLLLEFGDGHFNRYRGIDVSKDYDPEYLRDLRQPRPRDQPSDLPESFFTFDDAFEDLMWAHFSGDVLDIHEMASNRLYLRYKFPHGEPVVSQMHRFAGNGTFVIRRHDSMISGTRALVEVPERVVGALKSGNASSILEALREEEARSRPQDPVHAANPPSPQDELELIESTVENPPRSSWPSPLDALQAIFGVRSNDEGSTGKGITFTSSSESLRVNVDENGTTEEKTTEHTDDQGRRVRVVLERKLDREGRVISETKRQFIDGREMEKDVYAGLD